MSNNNNYLSYEDQKLKNLCEKLEREGREPDLYESEKMATLSMLSQMHDFYRDRI